MFTTIASYSDPIEAQIACGLLRSEGIDARVDDAHSTLANWEWRLAIGGAKLRVPREQAMHARRILQAQEAGDYALEPDDPDAALQPPDRESWSSRMAWVAFMLLNVPLPWRRRRTNDEAVRRV